MKRAERGHPIDYAAVASVGARHFRCGMAGRWRVLRHRVAPSPTHGRRIGPGGRTRSTTRIWPVGHTGDPDHDREWGRTDVRPTERWPRFAGLRDLASDQGRGSGGSLPAQRRLLAPARRAGAHAGQGPTTANMDRPCMVDLVARYASLCPRRRTVGLLSERDWLDENLVVGCGSVRSHGRARALQATTRGRRRDD